MTTTDDIRRSTLRHFIPGMALFWGAALLIGRELPGPWGFALLASETLGMITGYHLTLKLGRERLRRCSRIRGLAAGITTPLLAGVSLPLFSGLRFIFGIPGPFVLATGVSAAAGGFMAATMFIRRRRPELQEPAVAAELPGESLEDWFDRVEKQAEKQPWYRAVMESLTLFAGLTSPERAT